MSTQEQLSEYRRLAAERRIRMGGSSSESSSASSSTSLPSSKTTKPVDPANDQKNKPSETKKPKLHLTEVSAEEQLKKREEEVSMYSDVINPKTEKKKFLEKAKLEEEARMKKEREEKEFILKSLRTDPHVGKKSKAIDYPNIDNRVALNSPTKPSEKLETIFENVNEEEEEDAVPCIVQIKFMDGSATKTKFTSKDKLTQVCQYILQSEKAQGDDYKLGIKLKIPSSNLKIAYFDKNTMAKYDLAEVGLCPNGTVIIEKDSTENGFSLSHMKEDTSSKSITYMPVEYLLEYAGTSYRLKGESWEEKQKFRDRQREKEVQEHKEEKLKKKKELEAVRKRLEEDKKEREMRNSKSPSVGSSSSSSPAKQISLSSSLKPSDAKNASCCVQVKIFNGATVKIDSLIGNNTLHDLFKAVSDKAGLDVSASETVFMQTFPNKDYESSKFKHTHLYETNVVPRGSLVLELKSKAGKVSKGSSSTATDESSMDESD